MRVALFISVLAIAVIASLWACKKDDSNNTNSSNNTTDNDLSKQYPCLPANLVTGIVAFYTFGNSSLNDASGNNIHLTNTTTARPAADRNGNPNCAYEFNNGGTASEFLVATNVSALGGMTQMTISFWYQPLDTSLYGRFREWLVTRDSINASTGPKGAWRALLFDCRRAVFGHYDDLWEGPGVFKTDCLKSAQARTNIWHHYAATYDHATQEMKLYVDGALETKSATPIPDFALNSNGALRVGNLYTGRIDDIIIYNKVLTDNEIGKLKDMGSCCEKK